MSKREEINLLKYEVKTLKEDYGGLFKELQALKTYLKVKTVYQDNIKFEKSGEEVENAG